MMEIEREASYNSPVASRTSKNEPPGPNILSRTITKNLKIPTIGIGSSYHCDGQILVSDDIFGLTQSKIRFVKKYINIKSYIRKGIKKFRREVLNKKYPSRKYWY